jgi:hypothetical protein
MSEDEVMVVPARILKHSDEVFAEIVDTMKNENIIRDTDAVVSLDMKVDVEEPVRITDYELRGNNNE